jgi:hypothetical protein
MAKTKISEFDSTPANNTDIDSINIAEGCAPSGINNAIRELMSQLKDQQTGASGDNFTVGGNLAVTGTTTFTGAVVMSSALPIASGGTASTTAAGARTSLGVAASGANSDITSVTGLTTALTVAQGGTGAATHTSKGVLIGNGTSAITTVSPSTSGNVLISDGTNWTSSTSTGIAKAWVNYNGETQTVRTSYNVSSVTRSGTGFYTVNFTNALADADYCVTSGASSKFGSSWVTTQLYTLNASTETAPTSSAFTCTIQSSSTTYDVKYIFFSVFR